MTAKTPLLIIAGYGPGLGEAIARRFGDGGYRVVGLSRTAPQLSPEERGGTDVAHFTCDLTEEMASRRVFAEIIKGHGAPRVLIHNVARLVISPFAEIVSDTFAGAWRASCLSAFHCAAACLPVMEEAGGAMIFTGATASVRGGGNFAAFASAKFALRGLTQSLAREYGPKGIHVVHALIDGLIWGPQSIERFNPSKESCLDPVDIADTYFQLSHQPASAWTQEFDLRPASERF